MKLTSRSHWQLRLQNIGFYILFFCIIVMLGWLSTQYNYQTDWTHGNRNTISDASRAVLEMINQPVEITAYVTDDTALRKRIRERLKRFQRHKSDIRLHFVNPDLEPHRAQEAGVSHPGQLVIRTQGRSETIDDMAEATLINALQRLARAQERWVVFLEGHDERDPFAENNQGLSQLINRLKRSGLKAQQLNLVRMPTIAQNTSVLVIAAPQSNLLPGEVNLIKDYVDAGGNLLWLQDPGEMHGLQTVAQDLNIRFVNGVIVDANPQLRAMLGIRHPAVVPVVDYKAHPVTRRLKVQTLFPFAVSIEHTNDGTWQATPFLTTLPRTWSETGGFSGKEVTFNAASGDTAGPLTLGLSLIRQFEDREQRIIVIGDSDFLANGYLGNGGNLELALNVINWLSQDDALISIVPRTAPDTQLNLDDTVAALLGITFLVLLPLALLVTGYVIWFRRSRR